MFYVRFGTPLAWTWYVLLGSAITIILSFVFSLFIPAGDDSEQAAEVSV
jgi:hypothetical protein